MSASAIWDLLLFSNQNEKLCQNKKYENTAHSSKKRIFPLAKMNRTLELSFENMICDWFALCFLFALWRCRCDDKECFVRSRWPVKQRRRMRALKAEPACSAAKHSRLGESCCLKISFLKFYFSLVAFRSCDSCTSVTLTLLSCKRGMSVSPPLMKRARVRAAASATAAAAVNQPGRARWGQQTRQSVVAQAWCVLAEFALAMRMC